MTASHHRHAQAHSTPALRAPDARQAVADFEAVVNMSPETLTRWLETDASRTVGYKGASGRESVGHASGRRIVRLLAKHRDSLTPGDLAHMRKVVGYVHRHLAQRPAGSVKDTPWRYSLMNWGHDPLHTRRSSR